MKIILLEIGEPNAQNNRPVKLSIGGEKDYLHFRLIEEGELSEIPEPLLAAYQQWRSIYTNLDITRIKSTATQPDRPTQNSSFSYKVHENPNIEENLQKYCNHWLENNFNPDWIKIRDSILFEINSSEEEVNFILRSKNQTIQSLPWHLWETLMRNDIEVCQSFGLDKTPSISCSSKETINILVIRGGGQTLQTDEEEKLWQDLEELYGDKVRVILLNSPDKEKLKILWSQPWDILYFAGHTNTQEKAEAGQKGRIYINEEEYITTKDLQKTLGKAIKKGLRLAIFNSCNGIGIAEDLAQLQVPMPQVIFMKEPILDCVASKFLEYFLNSFTQGKSLSASVYDARIQLKELTEITIGKDKIKLPLPGIGMMPVIAWTLNTPPLTGKDFFSQPEESVVVAQEQSFLTRIIKSRPWKNCVSVLSCSLLVTGLVVGVRSLGWLQSWELDAYDHFMRTRPYEVLDDRILVVIATEEDIKNQQNKPTGYALANRASLSDKTLQKLLEKLNVYEPVTIGLDIHHDFPAEPELQHYLTQDNFFGICKAKAPKFGQTESIPPPDIPQKRISFADAAADNDAVLRRHILSRKPDNTGCTAENHLSFQLALEYLWKKERIKYELTSRKELKLNHAILRELTFNTGAYQNIDAQGRQIMLNYRALPSMLDIADTVTIGEVINDEIPDARIQTLKERIILVGIARSPAESNDYWKTPYSPFQQDIPGVFIQAHMVSQILSAALDQRPLIWTFSKQWETIWTLGWSIIVGLFSAYQFKSPTRLLIGMILTFSLLWGIYYYFFIKGLWLPLIPSILVIFFTALTTILSSYYNISKIYQSSNYKKTNPS